MSTAVATLPTAHSFPALLKQHSAEIARALPRHLTPDRMTRIALTEFRKNPKLAQCDPLSVFAAVIMASQLGLEPGLMGQCYLIPYGRECQLIPGYQGLLDLVRRSGKVRRIEAQVVYERDRFTYRTGLNVTLEHEPLLDGDRGEPRLAYAVAEFVDGGHHVEIMSRAQIEAIRDRGSNSQNAKRFGKKTPWDTDTDEMWRKTVLRRLCKFLPKSVELATAMALDDSAGKGVQGLTVREVAAGDWTPPPIDDDTPLLAAPVEVDPPANMDASTGEIPPPAEPVHPVSEPPTDPASDLLLLIAECQTVADLDALHKDVGRLRNGERTRCVDAWKARKAALTA
jgi:recombination protein RecT